MTDCCKDNSITIYRGYDTRFMGVDFLSIKFSGRESLDGYSAKFVLGGFSQTWDTLRDGVTINLTKEQTGALPLGLNYGTLVVWDNEGNSKPFTTSIPFNVVEWVEGKYQKIDTFNATVEAKLEGETQIEIKIETVNVEPSGIDGGAAATIFAEWQHVDGGFA